MKGKYLKKLMSVLSTALAIKDFRLQIETKNLQTPQTITNETTDTANKDNSRIGTKHQMCKMAIHFRWIMDRSSYGIQVRKLKRRNFCRLE